MYGTVKNLRAHTHLRTLIVANDDGDRRKCKLRSLLENVLR